jgi:hypothetical protein
MSDELFASIERARKAGAIVLLKWDGERTERVCTVLVTDPSIPFHFREDTDDIIGSLNEGLRQFAATQARSG